MILTRRQRLLGTLVLAAGAAASIATSQVSWDLTEYRELEPVLLDETTPAVGYAVHVEYTGDIGLPEGNISLTLSVEKEPANPATASLHASIVDDATGELVGEQDFVYDTTAPGPQGLWVSADAWSGCTDGCSRDFTIWVERTDVVDGSDWAQVQLTGGIEAYLVEYGEGEPPGGASLTLEVTPLPGSP